MIIKSKLPLYAILLYRNGELYVIGQSFRNAKKAYTYPLLHNKRHIPDQGSDQGYDVVVAVYSEFYPEIQLNEFYDKLGKVYDCGATGSVLVFLRGIDRFDDDREMLGIISLSSDDVETKIIPSVKLAIGELNTMSGLVTLWNYASGKSGVIL